MIILLKTDLEQGFTKEIIFGGSMLMKIGCHSTCPYGPNVPGSLCVIYCKSTSIITFIKFTLYWLPSEVIWCRFPWWYYGKLYKLTEVGNVSSKTFFFFLMAITVWKKKRKKVSLNQSSARVTNYCTKSLQFQLWWNLWNQLWFDEKEVWNSYFRKRSGNYPEWTTCV